MPETMVDVDILRAAMQLACRAPSLSNSQPWLWVAHTEPWLAAVPRLLCGNAFPANCIGKELNSIS